MRLAPVCTLALLLVASGCSLTPFQGPSAPASRPGGGTSSAPGGGPVITSVPDVNPSVPSAEGPDGGIAAPTPLPRERPKTAPATLSPASRALVGQAQGQRKRGDLPGASVSLERALRIEPNNPLLWIEMGRLRMDQRNYPQAEAMGRKPIALDAVEPASAIVKRFATGAMPSATTAESSDSIAPSSVKDKAAGSIS